MSFSTKELFREVYERNRASEKQCYKCIFYVAEYKEKDKTRPACRFNNNFSYVSHNPARLCRYYEEKLTEEQKQEIKRILE